MEAVEPVKNCVINSSFEEDIVSPNENDVTIPLSISLPKYLYKDRISSKFVFDFDKFDYSIEISKLKLDDEQFVKGLTWSMFNKEVRKLMSSYYSTLSRFYTYGLSAKFKRDFCVVVAMHLPFCNRKYKKLRKKSARGKLSPDLSDTVKKQLSLSDFLFIRLDQNSRTQVKKVAKENGKQLKVKKNISNIVAASNRKRKTLRLEQSKSPGR